MKSVEGGIVHKRRKESDNKEKAQITKKRGWLELCPLDWDACAGENECSNQTVDSPLSSKGKCAKGRRRSRNALREEKGGGGRE